MKKNYTKPVLFAESYELMEHVASNCVVNDGYAGANHRDITSCSYTDGNISLFTGGVGSCDTSWFTDVDENLIPSLENISALGVTCYNAFLIGDALFAS